MLLFNSLNIILKKVSEGKEETLLKETKSELNIENEDNKIIDLINTFGSAYNSIADLFNTVVNDAIESSTREGDKSYYSHTTPNYLGKLISRLKNVLNNEEEYEKFIQKEFKTFEWFYKDDAWRNDWLEQLAISKEMRKALDHKILLNVDKVESDGWDTLDHAIILLTEYWGDPDSKGSIKYGWFPVPTLSDSGSAEFIRFRRYTNGDIEDDFGNPLKATDIIIDKLVNLVNQEYDRIRLVVERDKELQRSGTRLKALTNYDVVRENGKVVDKGGAEFKFLPALNTYRDKEGNLFIQGLKNRVNSSSSGEEIREYIKEALRDVMENDFEAFFEKMSNIGLLEETPEGKYKHLNFKFKTAQSNYNNTIKNSLNKAKEILGKSFNSRMEKLLNSYANNKPIDDRFATAVFEEIKGLLLDKALQGEITEQVVKDISRNLRVHNTTKDGLREYFYNHVLATSQIIQLVTTDLAYYKNMEDFYKRIKQIHSPSTRLNTQATYKGKKIGREIERTILIKDEKIKSSMYEDVKELVEEKFKKGELSEIDKDFILSQYSKVNVTDAQAFRSLSSYRAVLGMMGEWTDEMQNTLERFEKGEWDIEDFLVIWQTKKPFMYTQVGKDSGVEGFGKIKQAIQHKNSEFLLLAMYNLMTSSKGGQNRLRAINKFMENNNIDVVQFDSTTKVGQQGAIDLSDVETEADIIAKLEKETGIKDGNINPDVVHEIPYEDYGIQQATPEHHIDRAMALGTQIRKLIIADISDTAEFVVNGKKYDKNSLIRMYQELITEGIIRGFQEVDEIFADPKKVEEILLNEVSNNPRYSSELVEACTLNEEGMFNIPLFDEVQSKRVQQLLLSVIRDRITKQKIKGGSFIQVSAFGYTDKLHIEWEGTGENKRIKYAQCYMPAYSRKFLEAYIDEKTGIIDISKVPEDLLQAVGYRVPTEDKYSMLPLKIVGFLPWQNGSAIMLPAEITAIAGSDYDVDKMYVVLPEFKTYEYDMARARKDFAKISSVFESILNDSNIKTNDLIEEVLDIDNNDFKEWFDSVKEEYKYDKPRLAKIKYNNNKPVKSQSKAAINNQVLDIMFSILTNSDTAIKIANPGGPKNIKRVSYILNVLKNTDEDTLFNRLQEIDKSKYSNKKELVSYLFNMPSDILEKLVNKNQNNPLSPISQLSAHDRIMAGANLIGGYANHNAAHAVAQFSELELTDSASFVLNGKVLKSLHDIKNMEKGFISRNTSEFLGAAVDNAKDPILGEFNQNFFTLDATMLLSRLGYTHLEIGLLLNQPIVRDITTNYLRGRKEYKKAEDAINEVITDYSKKALDVRREAPRNKNNSFLIEDLAKYIMVEKIATTDVNSTSNLDAIEFYQRQVEIGYLFQKIYTAADALGSLTSAIKADTTKGAAGPSIAETINKIQKLEKVFEAASKNPKYPLKGIDIIVPYDDSLLSLPLDEIREGIMKTRNPFLQAFYTLGLTSVSRFFSRYFPHFNPSFISVLNTLKDMTKTGSLNTKTINSIFSDLIAYIMSDVEFFGNSQEEGLTITQKRDYFINKFPEYFDKVVSENPDIAELEFIKRLKTVNKNKKNPVKTIVFKNVGRLSSTLRDRFTQEWESLLYSNNPKAQELALNLFRYNYYRNGFAFGPSTFIHLTPNAIRKIIPGYIEALNRILKDKNADYGKFVLQYIYNHLDNKQLVPSIPNNSSVVFEDDNKEVVKSFVFIPTESNKTEKFIKQINYIDGNPVFTLMDFVSKTIRGKEYYYRHMGNGLYQMIQPLGVKNNFIEYEFGKDVEEIISVVGENSQFYDPYSDTSTKFNSNNFTYDDATPEMPNDMELGSSYFDSLNDVGKSYFGEGFDVKVKDNDISSIKSNNDYKDSTGKKPC